MFNLKIPVMERQCPICGNFFRNRRKVKYCSKRCRNKAIGRKTARWISEVWGKSNAPNSLLAGRKAEEYVAETVLSQHGFKNIFLYAGNGPIDIFCEKDGEKYAVEVTTSYQYRLSLKKKRFLEWFGLKLLVCHIKPDFSWYTLKELKGMSSYCLGEYLKQRK